MHEAFLPLASRNARKSLMTIPVSPDLIAEIVQSVFATMLDLEVSAVESPCLPVGHRLTSSVYLHGDWNGAISLACSHPHACHFAGKFLACDPPESVDDDVRDVVGELTNMIGGNVKSHIPGTIRLSIPSVIDGSDYEMRVCGAQVENTIGFRFAEGDFCVTIRGGHGSPQDVPHRDSCSGNSR